MEQYNDDGLHYDTVSRMKQLDKIADYDGKLRQVYTWITEHKITMAQYLKLLNFIVHTSNHDG